MPSIPLPFIVGFAVALTLYRSLKGIEAPGSRAYFFAFVLLYALQGMIVGLRFGYGIEQLTAVQPVTAAIMPPLAFLAFRALAEPPPARPWLHVLGPLAVVMAVVVRPGLLDPLLLALFSFYGIALFRLTLTPEGDMVVAPFHRAGPVLRAARLTAILMLFFAASDGLLALYSTWYGTADVPLAVALMNLAVIAGLAIYYLAGDRIAAPSPAVTVQNVSKADEALLLRVSAALDSAELYKDETLSLTRLARRAGLPAREVSSVVNRAAGMNVSQFVNNRRVAEACRLLGETSSPMTDIMFASGFSTKSNFNREFRRVTGMSPRQWRANRPPL